MSEELKSAKQLAREATRGLLCLKPDDTVKGYISRINSAKTPFEVSIIMHEVRSII